MYLAKLMHDNAASAARWKIARSQQAIGKSRDGLKQTVLAFIQSAKHQKRLVQTVAFSVISPLP